MNAQIKSSTMASYRQVILFSNCCNHLLYMQRFGKVASWYLCMFVYGHILNTWFLLGWHAQHKTPRRIQPINNKQWIHFNNQTQKWTTTYQQYVTSLLFISKMPKFQPLQKSKQPLFCGSIRWRPPRMICMIFCICIIHCFGVLVAFVNLFVF